MKNTIVVLAVILIMSCNQTSNTKIVVETSTMVEKNENFDWLLGKWKRLNEEEGKETFENWEKLSATQYYGLGFTMKNGDTIKQEKMNLFNINGRWDLTVKVLNEAKPVTFKGVHHNTKTFTCKNKEIEFPNTIKYWKTDKNIKATVSGGDFKIDFEFERLK